jgi:hypothetical protein
MGRNVLTNDEIVAIAKIIGIDSAENLPDKEWLVNSIQARMGFAECYMMSGDPACCPNPGKKICMWSEDCICSTRTKQEAEEAIVRR